MPMLPQPFAAVCLAGKAANERAVVGQSIGPVSPAAVHAGGQRLRSRRRAEGARSGSAAGNFLHAISLLGKVFALMTLVGATSARQFSMGH